MKRALMYASVASMIQQFNMENIRLLQEQGYEVDVACNMEQGSSISNERIVAMKRELEADGVKVVHVPIPRKVTAIGDIFRSLRQTQKLMNERQYSLVHCHSPIGGMICRLAGCLSKNYGKQKMIYTAHGFHFYKGAPLQNWLMYYPVEKLCSFFTDVILTINNEDFLLAQKKMKAGKTVYIPGAGIDVAKFANAKCDRVAKRADIGVPDHALLLMSVGELNKNKNHSVVIHAIAQLKDENIHYAIAGKGNLKDELVSLADELGVGNQLHLLGYRTDVAELYSAADVCVFPSIREGLGLAALEGMAAGLPLICADNRGTRGFAEEGRTGYVCEANSKDEFADAISKILNNRDEAVAMGRYSQETSYRFDVHVVINQLTAIYKDVAIEP